MREAEPQILVALDILVRRWACGLTITQRRTRMSALQSPVPTTSEECEMRPLPLFMKRLTLAVELKQFTVPHGDLLQVQGGGQ